MKSFKLKRALRIVGMTAAILVATQPAVQAAPLKIEAVMSPKEQIQLDFADGSKHFVLMVRREGKASGQGILSGAAVTEYGRHDIIPGVSADPSGYLVFNLGNDGMAYIKWLVRGVFVPAAGGTPKLLDNGVWEVVSATGKLKGLKGAGTLHIQPVPPQDRKFLLEGELVQSP